MMKFLGFRRPRRAVLSLIAMATSACLPASAGPATAAPRIVIEEPITPIPQPRPMDVAKVALGERLFKDKRLSVDLSRSCHSCHELADNGATHGVADRALDGSPLAFNTSTIFNAALSFRFGWQGEFRSLESHVAATLQNPSIMGSSIPQVVSRLSADPELVRQFQSVYGRGPDERNLLDAIATFERTLVTTGSRFDGWLAGDASALSPQAQAGYAQFKSLGCITCHQGVNVGGNLFQRHGIFHPLVNAGPQIVRVPSLRNVATTAPYFHDGSAASLDVAVRRMASSQLNTTLTQSQVDQLVAFLGTLTGNYQGTRVGAQR
jgi:cytochrome c peroxidase